MQARPVFHRKRDSIEAHLTIVFAALAVSRWIENQTGWSIRKFVKIAPRYRTIEIQAGPHAITAADPIPYDLRQALDAINGNRLLAHQVGRSRVSASVACGSAPDGNLGRLVRMRCAAAMLVLSRQA